MAFQHHDKTALLAKYPAGLGLVPLKPWWGLHLAVSPPPPLSPVGLLTKEDRAWEVHRPWLRYYTQRQPMLCIRPLVA